MKGMDVYISPIVMPGIRTNTVGDKSREQSVEIKEEEDRPRVNLYETTARGRRRMRGTEAYKIPQTISSTKNSL